MKNFAGFFAFLFSFAAAGRNLPDTTGPKFSVMSSIGISAVDKEFKPSITNSTQSATGVELRFSPRLSITGVLGFDNYNYKQTGATYNFSGKLRSTSFDFSLRFKLATGSVQPYLKAGGGAVRFSVPVINASLANTTIENRVEVTGMATAEAGLQFRIFGRYSLFAAGERYFISESDLLNRSLRVTTFKLGLISAF